MALSELQRKCSNCSAIINYSKADAKSGNIPKEPLCPKCLRKVLRGERKEAGFKPGNPFNEIKEPKKSKSWKNKELD